MTEDLAPTPGVYPGVPMADYLAWPRYSRSWLAGLVAGDSPRAVRHAQTARREETAAQAFGTAFHLLVFEPVAALQQIAVAPKVDKRTKAGKAEWAAFQESAAGQVVVQAADWDTMRAMADALASHPVASGYLGKVTEREVSVAWDEPVFSSLPGGGVEFRGEQHHLSVASSALPFKARLDGLAPDDNLIVDLKTTSARGGFRASALARDTENYGYALQCALYPRAIEAHDMEGFEMVHVWVQKEPPYDVAVTRLTEESHRAAANATDWALDRLAELDATYGEEFPWPGPCETEPLDLNLHNLVRRFGREEE